MRFVTVWSESESSDTWLIVDTARDCVVAFVLDGEGGAKMAQDIADMLELEDVPVTHYPVRLARKCDAMLGRGIYT